MVLHCIQIGAQCAKPSVDVLWSTALYGSLSFELSHLRLPLGDTDPINGMPLDKFHRRADSPRARNRVSGTCIICKLSWMRVSNATPSLPFPSETTVL